MINRAELTRNIALTLGGLSAVIAGCKDQSPVVKFPALPTDTPSPAQEFVATATIPSTPTRIPTFTPVPPQVPTSTPYPQLSAEAVCSQPHEVAGNPGFLYPPHIDLSLKAENLPELDSKTGLNGHQRGYWLEVIDDQTGVGYMVSYQAYLSKDNSTAATFHGELNSIRGSDVLGINVGLLQRVPVKAHNRYVFRVFMGDDPQTKNLNQKFIADRYFNTPNCLVPTPAHPYLGR